jgi:hypothetical protein
MSAVDDARLMLTQCRDCLGCNRLEDETFRGSDECKVSVKDETVKHKEGQRYV